MTRNPPWTALFALIALVPAAVGAAPLAHRAGTITVPLCTGDGQARVVSVRLGRPDVPGAEQPGCCAKGCHGGSSRKKGATGCCDDEAGDDTVGDGAGDGA